MKPRGSRGPHGHRASTRGASGGKDVIGQGYHVRIQTRYAPALPSQFGSKTVADAEAFIEAEKAKHRPGRRRKVAA